MVSANLPGDGQKRSVAFLILAHNEPKLLARIISRLTAEWSSIFVHIDARADVEAFKREIASSRVTFLHGDQRVKVNWCGFSMVEATLNLMKSAVDSAANPGRFVLMSGVDYPIKPLPHIARVLSSDDEFIQIDLKIDPRGDNQFDRCLNRPFYRDNLWFNDRTSPVRLFPWATRKLEQRIVRRPPEGLDIFYGPSWWGLTREAVLEVLAFTEAKQALVRWFSGVRSPDESLFQTILKTTSRSGMIAFDKTRDGQPPIEETRNALHYVDWKAANPKLPRTLELSDLDAVLESGALFARKMNSTRSAALLDALDAACFQSR